MSLAWQLLKQYQVSIVIVSVWKAGAVLVRPFCGTAVRTLVFCFLFRENVSCHVPLYDSKHASMVVLRVGTRCFLFPSLCDCSLDLVQSRVFVFVFWLPLVCLEFFSLGVYSGWWSKNCHERAAFVARFACVERGLHRTRFFRMRGSNRGDQTHDGCSLV